MDKTISISLGGYAFTVNEGAYGKLKNYLAEIRLSLKGMEGTEEIISDVEIRIAEIFRERMQFREVVEESDVEKVVEIMGRPEQYAEGAEETDSGDSHSKFSSAAGSTVKKKLFRDIDNRVLGGVLSGLANYMGLEPWVTRLIFILLLFTDTFISLGSLSVLTYIVLWIIVPPARTATQRYEMMGEAGDLESIKKTGSGKSQSDPLGDILRVIAKIFLICFGVFLLMSGIGLLIGVLVLLFAVAFTVPMQFMGLVLDGPWQEWSFKAFIFILCAVPAILLTLLGARMISSRVKINRWFILGSLILWVASLIGVSALSIMVAKSFSTEVEVAESRAYTPVQDTITLMFNTDNNVGSATVVKAWDMEVEGFKKIDDAYYHDVKKQVEVRASHDDKVHVETIYVSKGSNVDDATKNAAKIEYEYKMNSEGELSFNDYLKLPEGSKFRVQKVKLIVYMPENKVLSTRNVNTLITVNPQTGRKTYRNGKNKLYTFAGGIPECQNCAASTSQTETSDSKRGSEVHISPVEIRVEDDEEKVIINPKKIQITDGSDSVNIDFSGN